MNPAHLNNRELADFADAWREKYLPRNGNVDKLVRALASRLRECGEAYKSTQPKERGDAQHVDVPDAP